MQHPTRLRSLTALAAFVAASCLAPTAISSAQPSTAASIALASCGTDCNNFYDGTGRWKAIADPDGSGRVVCSNWRLTASMNDTAHTLPNFDISSKNRTYQGYFPNCPDNLPQVEGAMQTRAYGYLNDSGYFYQYIQTSLTGNAQGTSTALSSISLDRFAPEGYYYLYGSYAWTAWGNTYHYESPHTPIWFYCRTDQHNC